MSVETSLPWPSNIPELKRLDELLRCGICYEFMSTSMVTVCSHNYCSLCIRQYLGYKTQCPACFQETTCQQLRNNRLLDEIISLFPNLRDKTARQCQFAKGNTISGYLVKDGEDNDCNATFNGDHNAPGPSSRPDSPSIRNKAREKEGIDNLLLSPRSTRSPLLAETPKRSFNNTPLKSPLLPPFTPSPVVNHSNNSNIKPIVKASSSGLLSPTSSSSAALTQSGRQSVSGYFSILNDKPTTNGTNDEPKVKCPVCSVQVPERNINLHLDACLKRMEEGDKEEIICVDLPPKRKPLPKLVYSLLNEKQMKQKLKEIGLSMQGDKHQLVNRHKRYTILYNAECDVEEPRPVQDILRQVEREEKEETKATTNRSIFTYDRKTDPKVIEKEQEKYIKKNTDHFAKLVADVKRRQEEAKKRKQMSKENEATEDRITIPSTSKSNNYNAKINKHHHMSSSDDDSDCDSAKVKSTPNRDKANVKSTPNTVRVNGKSTSKSDCGNVNLTPSKRTERKGSLLDFFQNSPKKVPSLALCEDFVPNNTSVLSQVNGNIKSGDDDCSKNKTDTFLLSQDIVILNDNDKLKNKNGISKLFINDKSISSNAQKNHSTPSLDDEFYKANENATHPLVEEIISSAEAGKTIEPSPDIFAASPAKSDCSDASESLLVDREDDDDFFDLPSTVPIVHDVESLGCASDDEDVIPSRQPESCPLAEDADFQLPPSPSVGRKITRGSRPVSPSSPSVGRRLTRGSRSLSQQNQPQQDLSALGPETQDLDIDSQVTDPEYQPSQLMEDLDMEEVVPETSRKSKRVSKKRTVNDATADLSERPRTRRRKT